MLIQKGAMHMKTYGYIRVSSTDQNEDRQRLAMRALCKTFWKLSVVFFY